MAVDITAAEDSRWQTLRLVNGIRMALAIALLFLAVFSINAENRHDGTVLAIIAASFALQGLIAAHQLHHRQPRLNTQISFQLGIDFLLLITLVAFSSRDSNYASLLFIPCVAGSLLYPGVRAYLYASLASLALLALQAEVFWRMGTDAGLFTQAGLLGIAFFGIALIGHMVAARLLASQTQLRQTDINLANLEAASGVVIQNLDSGVVVVDGDNRVQIINTAASQMLDIKLPLQGKTVAAGAPLLNEQIVRWRMDQARETPSFSVNGRDLVPRFVPVGKQGRSGLLIFLDDAEQLSSEAQQNKLASLGQLTASIAHEMRNPLSAINHAAQLLNESPTLDEADAHLSEIIREQVLRVDAVISSVLKLSRREKPLPVAIPLASWLAQFRSCFILEHQLLANDFEISGSNDKAEIRMDESQLDQVISNLCCNALQYSRENNASAPLLQLNYAYDTASSCWFIEVKDQGAGIPPKLQDDIFVPFFTTRHDGTGLGLYLARSLCETNGARLVLKETGAEGTVFRISFPAPLYSPRDQSHA